MLSRFKFSARKSLHDLITSSLIIDHYFLKQKNPLKPSGPGARSKGMSFNTAWISSKEKVHPKMANQPAK
jgi:hypothetical protein